MNPINVLASIALSRRRLLGVGDSAIAATMVGAFSAAPGVARATPAEVSHPSSGAGKMPHITTRDGVQIFCKNWEPVNLSSSRTDGR